MTDDNNILDLLGSTDAGFWAQEFIRIRKQVLVQRKEDIADDEGTMAAWFANCMASATKEWEMKDMLRRAGVETFDEYLEQLANDD